MKKRQTTFSKSQDNTRITRLSLFHWTMNADTSTSYKRADGLLAFSRLSIDFYPVKEHDKLSLHHVSDPEKKMKKKKIDEEKEKARRKKRLFPYFLIVKKCKQRLLSTRNPQWLRKNIEADLWKSEALK